MYDWAVCRSFGGSFDPGGKIPNRSSLLTVEAQHILGGSALDDDEVDHDKTDTFKPWSPSPSTTDVLSLIQNIR